MAVQPKLPNLPRSPRTALFRLIDAQLRNDPVLRSAGLRVYSWEGLPTDKAPSAIGSAPWLRLTPRPGPEDWWASSTMLGWLFVDCEVSVTGTCVDDTDNLWYAVERACYPVDAAKRLDFQRRLCAAGAHTGQIRFGQPAIVDTGDADQLSATAGLAVEYRFDQNPTAPGL